MMPLSRLGCPLSLKTPNMGNPGWNGFGARMDARRGGLSGFGTGPRALSGEEYRGMQESVHEEIIARVFVGIKDGLAIHEGH